MPEIALPPRRRRRLPDAPKLADVEGIVAAVAGDDPLALRNTAILELTYSCGLRSAEVVGLRLADVDFDQETVHVLGKGGKERVVPLGERAALRGRRVPAGRAACARARARTTRCSSPSAAARSTPPCCAG